MSRVDHEAPGLAAALTRRTPAFTPAYRPAPPSLLGQFWAALTRSTPAFTGAQPPQTSVARAGVRSTSGPQSETPGIPGSHAQANPVDVEHVPGVQSAALADEELDALLNTVQEARFGLAQPKVHARSSNAAIEVVTAPEDPGRFTVTVRIATSPSHSVPAGTSFGLAVDDTYFLAIADAEGSAVFDGVPPGEWRLRRLGRRSAGRWGGPSLVLPLARPRADLAAAGRDGDAAILRVMLPGAQAVLILHRQDPAGYMLEVMLRTPNAVPLVVTVRYGTTDGGERFLLIPVLDTSVARLPGYSPTLSWQASPPLPPDEIRTWEVGAVTMSVRAGANNANRRAWRELGNVVPRIRRLIDEELEKPR